MQIVDHDKRFELKVISHEFSGSESYHDRNWLKVAVAIEDGDLSWQAEDNCLLTYELVRLRDWISNIFVEREHQILFTENELGFCVSEDNSELTVILDFNFHPKGRNYDYGESGDDEYLLTFNFNEKRQSALLKNIDALIKQFPIKE